jgi:hypothetical protein
VLEHGGGDVSLLLDLLGRERRLLFPAGTFLPTEKGFYAVVGLAAAVNGRGVAARVLDALPT